MALRLISVSSMSDEEYTDIRELLDQNSIQYYVTPPGNWGFSMEAIWLKNNNDAQTSNKLLQEYYLKKNIEYSSIRELENKNKNILQKLISNPNVVALYIPTLIIVLLMVFLLT